MFWVTQKPIQNYRIGEVVEELPGSDKSVAWMKRDITELGRPSWFLEVWGRWSRPKDR
jgi:hypothetical protein